MWVSPPAGTVGPGPSDERMYVLGPVEKPAPYGIAFTSSGTPFFYAPPWQGPIHPPALPDANGHFAHLHLGSAQFEMAHSYGCVRFVLDVWERYFGRPIAWHFSPDYQQLEITLLPGWDNGHVGWGFMELGGHTSKEREFFPFSLSFDTIAHELGHLIIYSEVGIPPLHGVESEYFGFH
jgi:hypothetical protein